ncbi:hypothetical protein B296_00042327 [Ensete ventricosum]|uniref:Uncharacterized protein n=1 Tax=Ensete ventricosum TaxID=4639 RepID=A0A426X8X9_ENSVE|nr:hypothetical protein B296_00042327 [Ensete ventricosum]
MYVASPALKVSSGASSPTSGGCASTSSTLGTQWSPGPSSSSWTFSSTSSSTLSSLMPSLVVPMMWWSRSPSPHLRPLLPLPLHQR